MSRRINVNPAHYKVAGRERQGEDIIQSAQKQAFGKQQATEGRWQAKHGAAPWETTPPAPLVDTPEERERAEQAERRAMKRAKTSRKSARAKSAKSAKRRVPAARRSKANTGGMKRKASKTTRRPKTAAKRRAPKRRSARR